MKIRFLNAKVGMPFEMHIQEKISAVLPFACKPDALSLTDPGRNFYLQCFGNRLRTARSSLQADMTGGPVQRFFKRDHDIRFSIDRNLRRSRLAVPISTGARKRVTHICASPAKHRFKKLAEP